MLSLTYEAKHIAAVRRVYTVGGGSSQAPIHRISTTSPNMHQWLIRRVILNTRDNETTQLGKRIYKRKVSIVGYDFCTFEEQNVCALVVLLSLGSNNHVAVVEPICRSKDVAALVGSGQIHTAVNHATAGEST